MGTNRGDRKSGEAEATLQRAGVVEIETALAAGEPVTRILVRSQVADEAVARLLARAQQLGIPIATASEGDLRRLSRITPAAPVLALLGRDPAASPEELFDRPGAKWLLVGATYPGNVGAALRTMEVSGAEGAFVAAELDRAGRRAALRTSMNADRFMPIHWEPADGVIERARSTGHRIVALEDVGDHAPWQVDLLPPSLFVVGGEDRSLPGALLARCDVVVRLPMEGFVPCYNLQAAVAAVALERLRQAGSALR